jgi:endonuclease/exonuclease/phosphatase (EEP) superfamily protein YafD
VRDLSPIFDGAAVVLPPLLGGLLGVAIIGALATRGAEGALVFLSWLLFSLAAIGGPWVPQSSPAPVQPLRIVSANLGEVTQPFSAIEDVLAQNPDVLVVAEDDFVLDLLLSSHYEDSYLFERSTNVGVYSRFPFEVGEIPDERFAGHGFRAEIQAPSGTFIVYALHLPRPWFRNEGPRYISLEGQRAYGEALAEAAASEPYPVVIAGDLNLTDRAGGYRELASDLRDAVLTGRGGPTSTQFRWRPLLLRIDHIFVSRDWCAANGGRFDASTADHRGVRADIGPCAS